MLLAVVALLALAPRDIAPHFELVQPELFGATGGQPQRLGRLRQRRRSRRVRRFPRPPESPLSPGSRTIRGRRRSSRPRRQRRDARARAWGDFDGDGHVDLYVGFIDGTPNKLYRNDGDGRHFTDVAPALGVDLDGRDRARCRGSTTTTTAISICSSRSATSRTGCFATTAAASPTSPPSRASAIRARPSARSGSTSTATAISICSWPTRTATPTGCFGTTRGHFVDVAREWGVEAPRRSAEFGGVGAAVADFDGDGLLDLFVANYGPSALYRNDRRPAVRRRDAGSAGLLFEQHATTPSWGDYDNDGRPDLYVAGFLVNETHYPDHLFHNGDGHPRIRGSRRAAGARQRTRRQPRRAVGGFRRRRRARPRAREQRSRRRALPVSEPAAAGGRRGSRSPIDVVDAKGRHTKPGAEVACLRRGHAAADFVGPGRHRWRLLLAERHAGARRHGAAQRAWTSRSRRCRRASARR